MAAAVDEKVINRYLTDNIYDPRKSEVRKKEIMKVKLTTNMSAPEVDQAYVAFLLMRNKLKRLKI